MIGSTRLRFLIAIWICYAGLALPQSATQSAIDLKGTVTEVDFEYPSVYFYVAVKAGTGTSAQWECKAGTPDAMDRSGWDKDALQKNDTVTLHGPLTANGAHLSVETLTANHLKLPNAPGIACDLKPAPTK